MKTLIFGKTGQVARELLAKFPKGAEPTALDRETADLSDPEACARAIKTHRPDVVINAAAYTGVDRAEEDEALAALVNGAAPTAMAEACADLDIPFLHVSTDYVFDGAGARPWTPGDPTAPLGAYGWTKLAGERGVEAAGARFAILRTSWVFSAHGGNFVKTMLRLAETRDQLTVVGDQVGGPTGATDIAAALWVMAGALHRGKGRSGVYHFAGAPDVSWADFAREIFAQSGAETQVADIPTEDYPTPAKRPLNSRLDCSDLETHFAIKRPDWRVSLGHVLQELGAIS